MATKRVSSPRTANKGRVPRRAASWSRLSAISLKNFKIFHELSLLRLAPLTFVTGENSSGKVS